MQTVLGNKTRRAEVLTSGGSINASLVTGIDSGNVTSIAIDGSELLVNHRGGNAGEGSIYEYTLGDIPGTITSSDTSFITGLYEPTGIAVESLDVPEPSSIALCSLGAAALLAAFRSRRMKSC